MGKMGGKQRHGGKGEASLITDPRFVAVHSDPRFQKLPRNKLKVAVDKRFERMFKDKEFLDPFSADKRGRPKKKKGKRTLERYYRIEDEQKNREDAAVENSAPESDDADDKDEQVEDEENVGDGVEETSSSASESDSEASLSDREFEEDYPEDEEKVPTTEAETKRIAVVNMDWQNIKAADLLVLFNSFLPKGGHIESVTIYPSQFGLEQMKQEQAKGPEIFKDDEPNDDGENGAINQMKLREYEKSKLRYYFAVVVCDSISTASFLYKSCDGTEFERTSNILDMRFIPDEMTFEVEPRDAASEAPQDYEAPDFCTGALQHSKVKLTWDDDEPVRVKHLRRKFNAEELDKMDFKAYLASDDEEDEEEDGGEKEDKISRYKSLLLGDGEDGTSGKDDVDMEVTFPSGLDELSKKFLEQKESKAKGEETVWDAYLRKKKEKKKKNGKTQPEEREEAKGKAMETGEDMDDAFNDPFFNSEAGEAVDSEAEDDGEKKNPSRKPVDAEERKQKREERIQKKKDEERSKAELELLLMDDKTTRDAGVKGFNLQRKKQKGKKKGKDRDARDEGLLSTANYDDPRFASLFTSPHFAVDPTDPQFKRSAAKLRTVAELQQRKFKRGEEEQTENRVEQGKRKKLELSSLVRSVKRKTARST